MAKQVTATETRWGVVIQHAKQGQCGPAPRQPHFLARFGLPGGVDDDPCIRTYRTRMQAREAATARRSWYTSASVVRLKVTWQQI